MNFKFALITVENIHRYKRLKKIYADYKFRTLKNHGEKPFGKKQLSGLFDLSVKNKDNQFIVMECDGKFLGFAVISICSKDMVDIPFSYGTVNDFFISPKHRRKGYGRKLNSFIENIFVKSGIDTVLLHPDPVTGIDFWKAVGYENTGINGGWRRWQVYIKTLRETDNAKNIKAAIEKLVTQTDLIPVNPYNKNQLKELAAVYREYCLENSLRYRKKDVKAIAVTARKIKEAKLNALYFEGRIIGFFYHNEKERRYVLPQYRQLVEVKNCSYIVKPLEEKDIHFVSNLMSEESNCSALHTSRHSLDEWTAVFKEAENDNDEENFIVYKNDIPCAWLKLNGLLNTDTAWISMLVVADKYKNQGIGKFAVEYAFEYLQHKGFKKIGVQTTKDHIVAINLYRKCGFAVDSQSATKVIMYKGK